MSLKATAIAEAMLSTTDAEKLDKLTKAVSVLTQPQRDSLWKSMDTQLEREGTKIVLPAVPVPMSIDEGINVLKRIKDEEAQVFEVSEVVPGIPWDAAVATYKAMQEIYGVVTSTTTFGFFGPNHPSFLSVTIGPLPGQVLQIPVGDLMLPNSKVTYKFGIFDEGAFIRGKVNKKDRERLVEIAARAKEIMKAGSIYRGHAIRIDANPDGTLDMSKQPEFIDLSGVSRDDIIHNDVAAGLIDTNIFSPLENTEKCRRFKVPLKRGILLEGGYGTGKTLTALVTAKIATDNGWTFIMLSRCNALAAAINFSKLIQPVAIFTEDLDRFSDRSNEQVNDLVNTLDGLDTKTNEVLVVVTTNHVELFDKAILRPGRFDAVISLLPPDEKTSQKLIRKYAGDYLEPVTKEGEAMLIEIGQVLKGQVPASIREVVQRAHLANMQRGEDSILIKDILVSAQGMLRHFELLAEHKGMPSKAEVLHSSISGLTKEAAEAATEKLWRAVEAIADVTGAELES